MPELLLEFLTEEIPARMQPHAAQNLERALRAALTDGGLTPEHVETFVGPRRLTAVVEGLAAKSPDVREERKGPRVGAPDKAVEGFLRGAGLTDIAQAEQREDKKGAYYVAVIEREGRDTASIIAEAAPDIVKKFPWPKSMRWGSGTTRWVRPLQRIVCLFDGRVVAFSVAGLEAGNVTEGHRVMHRGPFLVANFKAYRDALEQQGHVMLDAGARSERIFSQAQALCGEAGLELVDDAGLLAEVAGLVEWPVALMGDMDPAFLDLPPEVIRLTMRTHQKYFAVKDPETQALAPKFIVVANQDAPDGGAAIAAGNGRVLSARLSDARHFWDQDRRTPLHAKVDRLDGIVFHAQLGTVRDKMARVTALAGEIAPKLGADRELVSVAARVCKADLVSGMVGEFPELQGVIGRYYALMDAGFDPLDAKKRRKKGEGPLGELPAKDARAVADAIADHYKPAGPSDTAPRHPVSAALALADKLDTLIGFWVIDQKPTGSADPYALRRAALGVVRILIEGGFRMPFARSEELELAQIPHGFGTGQVTSGLLFDHVMRETGDFVGIGGKRLDDLSMIGPEAVQGVLAFIGERLKVYLRDQGARHDLVDAVFALGEDDIVLIVKRVEALGAFLETDDGAELAAGYKRAANILRAEAKKEKKSAAAYGVDVDEALFSQPEETALFAALSEAEAIAREAVRREDFAAAMAAIAALRPRVDAFFDQVTVNTDDPALRTNRLALLSVLPKALSTVADFSRIGG